MNLVSTQIIVPQHIEYLIVDRDLVICEHSPNIFRFFSSERRLSIGEHIQLILPELVDYQQTIEKILNGKEKYYSLPKLLINPQSNLSTSHLKDSALSFSQAYFKLHLAPYSQANSNYLIIFLEEVIDRTNLIPSLSDTIDKYNLVHDISQLSSQLTQSIYLYESIFASLAEALIITDKLGIIQQINQATIDLLGYSEADLVNRSINHIIADPNFLLSEIQQYLLTQGELLKNLEVICRTQQGSTKILSFTCSKIEEDERLIYLGRDITNFKSYQQRQTIQSAISKILASSQDFTQASPKILQVICENLHLVGGEIWVAANENNTETIEEVILKCESIWTKNPIIMSELIEATEANKYKLEEDIVGYIWSNNNYYCYDNSSTESDFARQKIADRLGIKRGFGFPIQGDNNILAVLNFWDRKGNKLDQNLIDLIQSIVDRLAQFIQRKQAEKALREQQEKSEKLLLNIFPKIIAEQLKKQNSTIADSFDSVTILFADLVDFTDLFSQLPPIEIVEILNEVFSEFDRISSNYGLEKIKIIGDAYMVVGGLPQQRKDHAEAIAQMALDMQKAIAQFNLETDKTLSIRIGINTGAVIAGVIGTKKLSYDLWGDAVNIACRMESHGLPNQIQVSGSTYELLKDKYVFKPRGTIAIKGKGKMNTYFLVDKKL